MVGLRTGEPGRPDRPLGASGGGTEHEGQEGPHDN